MSGPVANPRPLFVRPAYIAAIVILSVSAVAMSAAISSFKLYLRKEKIYAPDGRMVSAIPSESESFVRLGSDQRMPPEIEEVLGTPNYVSRVYLEKEPRPGKERRALQFHAAYYTGMIDTVPHVPDRCMVGAGMQLKGVVGDIPMPVRTEDWLENEDVPEAMRGRIFRAKTQDKHTDLPNTRINLPRDAKDLKLRVTHFEDESGRAIYAGYFFIANGGIVSRAEGVRLLAFDLRSTYSYYLKVEFQSHLVETAEELAELAAAWLDENFAEVMRCVPDWVKVESGEYPPRTGSADNTAAAGSGKSNAPGAGGTNQ
ncbi:MAG: hypothetical protein JNK25_14200 [Phycisphaerae bacterium]|nr:hypothetical protein [Phycisphaerae bacterium]